MLRPPQCRSTHRPIGKGMRSYACDRLPIDAADLPPISLRGPSFMRGPENLPLTSPRNAPRMGPPLMNERRPNFTAAKSRGSSRGGCRTALRQSSIRQVLNAALQGGSSKAPFAG